MGTRLGELVERFGGQLMGDANLEVTGIAPLTDAGVSHISFLSNSKLRAQALQTAAAALIVSPADDEFIAAGYSGARIVTPNPYVYFAKAAQYFYSLTAIVPPAGVHPTAFIGEGAQIAATAHIGPKVVVEAGAVIGEHAVIDAGCYIGREAVIGEGTHFFANVTFHAYCQIGARGIIHSGAVIGTDGFGFANEKGVYIKIPQTGRVMIGDDVDIGANTTVDRGALADTVIEDGVKLDNLIQIAHNCHIGAHTAMAGCVGMAGSTTVGKYCTFGGAAMINGHITIADHVNVGPSTMIPRSLTEPGTYIGYYPMSRPAEWEKSAVIVRNLAAMRDKVRALEKTIKTLTNQEEK
ncbi:UDP-3-O-[3-hydroxymyristoyl] glucosamine N-acyltransferase [Duganella sp. 1411]|jgi:UDP-3-O-[3-hydroxymyristoyl] glucosamine N-acyltransferase|uniref:UDP-3-O-(3-hydroxymyristoyl)glucosamine N-acyltransferase n=1 Tax=Duganella sp. 1411 TaxID=2806572 RepID=UPI001AE78779|nr:UDP-3-O-(3-hydroxymyristoyl)glucosamine N-acyltransferase [Duganella sp. 1411]MBP1203066.1 UDP-3-O-[3-hydroxymyristoyl] glucosamine N-acyltransferase [Duganella sp. 1411]